MTQYTFQSEERALPEGHSRLRARPITRELLEQAMQSGEPVQGRVLLCTEGYDLMVALGEEQGIIPREETVLAFGGEPKPVAIVTRVGKAVSVCVTGMQTLPEGGCRWLLSRKKAQEKALDRLLAATVEGDVLDARITHLEPFGAFADIGGGLVGLIPLSAISVSRIGHPRDRFSPGQEIKVVLRAADPVTGRITLSHKELLGTWEQNAALFSAGQTVAGIVRSVEPYGIFVELTPNLAGLCEWRPGVCPGMGAAVYIKSILYDRSKVKLALVDLTEPPPRMPLRYFQTEGHIDEFFYSPFAHTAGV